MISPPGAPVPDLAADLVERVGRQLHDVKRVDAARRLRGALGDRSADPAGHVGGHQLQLFAALFAQLVEEREHRGAVAARGGPHQPAGVVVDDDSQIALALAVAYLVDPDPLEVREQVDLTRGFGADTLEDAPDRPPADPHHLSDRRLGRVHGKPRGLVLEVAREPRAMARPWHRADDDAVIAAGHPRRHGLDERHRRPEVKRSPAPPPIAEIKSRRPAPAHPAAITSRQPGRAHTTTASSSMNTSSTTARRSPSSRAHTLIPRTSLRLPGFQPSRSRKP